MENIIKGKAFVLKDNIDTDQIIPAEHLVYKMDDENESKLYGKYALSGVPVQDLNGNPFIKNGEYSSIYSIIIAGKNFGCGSSREHAPFALQKAGIKAIIAQDYARIFYRNSIDGGFLIPFEISKRLINEVKTGDDFEINVINCTLKNFMNGKIYKLKSLGEIKSIIEAGDIFKYAKKMKLF